MLCKAWLDLRLNTAAALISFLVAACAAVERGRLGSMVQAGCPIRWNAQW